MAQSVFDFILFLDENEAIMISPPKDPLSINSNQEIDNQINSNPPAEKEIIKISYSPSKG